MLQESWQLDLFGQVRLRRGADIRERFRERKAVSLLAALCLEPSGALPRLRLVEILWPDADGLAARNRFRVTLHHLRDLVEPPGVESGSIVRADRNTISIAPAAVFCDAAELIALHRRISRQPEPADRLMLLENALARCHGEFMPGFDDEWTCTQRERLDRLRFEILRRLTRDALTCGDAERILPAARRAIELEPFDDDAHADLIRALASAGQMFAALRHYEQLERTLSRELGATPSADVRRLAHELRQQIATAEPSPSPTTPGQNGAETVGARRLSRSLPVRLTRFFGREPEMATLLEWLAPDADIRLVTLLGPGGIGKTRLAIETAERLLNVYDGRVYFAALADLFFAAQVGDALRLALRCPPVENLDPLAQVLAILDHAPALLILDNAEHLLPDLRDFIGLLLTAAPGLRCLVTSRRDIGIDGERRFPVGLLPLPQSEIDAATMHSFAGIALFVDRACAARPDFVLSAHNASEVASLCRRLEGLPLALELAAARSRLVGVREMNAQADTLLDLLVDSSGAKETRHRSLRASIVGSYRLLAARLQALFDILSVFQGGFTVAAAAAVCADRDDAAMPLREMREILQQLVATSLATVGEDKNRRTRFGMLEALRAFGQEQLRAGGQECHARALHLRWYASLCAGGAPNEETLEGEEANLRSALTFGLGPDADPDNHAAALGLAASLSDHWMRRGEFTEGRDWLRRALQLPIDEALKVGARTAAARLAIGQGDYDEAETLARAALLSANWDIAARIDNQIHLGRIAFRHGRYDEARDWFVAGLALCAGTLPGAPHDPAREAECETNLGMVAWYQADHAAARFHLETALAQNRARGAEHGVADCLLKLGNVIRDRGDLAGGAQLLQEALEQFRALDDPMGTAMALHDLGLIAFFRGDLANSDALFLDAFERYRALGAQPGCAVCQHNRGELLRLCGRLDDAKRCLQDALATYRRLGDNRGIAASLHAMATVLEAQRQIGPALELAREALKIDQSIGNRQGIATDLRCLALLALAQNDTCLAETYLREALAVNRAIDSAVPTSQTLLGVALLKERQGDLRGAAFVAGAADALRRSIIPGPDGDPGDARRAAELRAALERALGKDEAGHCFDEGANGPLDTDWLLMMG